MNRGTSTAARIGAPLAFLLAATVLVLLVRAALDPAEQTAATDTAAVETQPAQGPEEQEPPAQTQPAQTQPPQTRPAETQPAQTQTEAEAAYHEIQSGDTLEAIAAQYGTTVERLLELNPGIDPVALTVGERVRVS